MAGTDGWKDFAQLIDGLTNVGVLREFALLAACVGLAWFLARQLMRKFAAGATTVLFGRNVFDGVLFPVLALVFVIIARRAVQ